MQTFACTHAITAFGPDADAVGAVELGEPFRLETADCYDGMITGPEILRPQVQVPRFNPATGPVHIHGVAAGQWVRIEIEDITVSEQGVMALSPGLGLLGDQVTAASTRIVRIVNDQAWLTETLSVPVHPMVGVMGVATSTESVPTSTPGRHGGNLDTKLLSKGASLIVQAQQPGALIAAGDLHARQGDGESGGTGIEIGGDITLCVTTVEHDGSHPLVLTGDGVYVLASAASFDEAIRHAFAEAVDLVAMGCELSRDDAYRLTSICGDAQVSQLVNPQVTARFFVPRDLCPAPLRAENGDQGIASPDPGQ